MDKNFVKVLLVEDNNDEASVLISTLDEIKTYSFNFTHVQYLKDALNKLETEQFGVILLDLMLPDSQGFDTFFKIKQYASMMPIVVLTGIDDDIFALKAVHDGAQDYVVKHQANSRVLSRVMRYAIERHRLLSEVQSLSLTDELTGLYNRRGFLLFANQHLKLAERKKEEFFIVFADLDNLKAINDKFGHHEGDNALKETAQVIKNSFRDSDIVSRIGGDEFAVLTIQNPDKIARIMTLRLEEKFKNYNTNRPRPCQLSVSIGIARYNFNGLSTIEELLSHADSLMYEQKQKKKSQFETLLNSKEIVER